jgi:hypothetical protein
VCKAYYDHEILKPSIYSTGKQAARDGKERLKDKAKSPIVLVNTIPRSRGPRKTMGVELQQVDALQIECLGVRKEISLKK